MSATILKFPTRGPFTVRVERESDPDYGGWLVLCRSHGWLHGDFSTALRDAHEIAAGYGVAVRSSAGIAPC
jgi:hypothetical protein